MDAKEIQRRISAYNLMGALESVLDVAIDGGCPPPTTIYAAFSRNSSNRERLIVDLAKQLVEAHEAKVENALAAAVA